MPRVTSSSPSIPGGPAVLRDLPARFTYIGKPEEPARVDVVRRPRPERLRRAARAWAVCWGAAAVAVFIPLLHFLLVPAFAIAGPLVARSRWLERATILSARGRCPGCDAALDLALRVPAGAELPWRCTACGRPLVLRLDVSVLEAGAGAAT